MTAKEKADELVNKFCRCDITIQGRYSDYQGLLYNHAIKCSIIVVDEMINYIQGMSDIKSKIFIDDVEYTVIDLLKFWQEVKTEL